MVPCFNCNKHSQWLINGEVWIDGKKIAQAPKRQNGATSSTMIGDKIYVNGYEYKTGKWRRTFAALWHLWFQEVYMQTAEDIRKEIVNGLFNGFCGKWLKLKNVDYVFKLWKMFKKVFRHRL